MPLSPSQAGRSRSTDSADPTTRALERPAVSLVMVVHNGMPYVEAAVRSMMTQILREIEIIVVDDASTDETPQVLARFADEDPRSRILTNETNLKLAASLNRGLEVARAPLIARMDAEDLSAPDRLTVQAAYMDARAPLASPTRDRKRAFGPRHGDATPRRSGRGLIPFRRAYSISNRSCRQRYSSGYGECSPTTSRMPRHQIWLRRQAVQLAATAFQRSRMSKDTILRAFLGPGREFLSALGLRYLETQGLLPRSLRADPDPVET